MAYPIPTAYSPADLINYSNTVSGGFWGSGLLLFIMGLVFMALNGYDATRRMSASLFAGFIASVFMGALGGIDPNISVLLGLLLAISFFLQKEY